MRSEHACRTRDQFVCLSAVCVCWVSVSVCMFMIGKRYFREAIRVMGADWGVRCSDISAMDCGDRLIKANKWWLQDLERLREIEMYGLHNSGRGDIRMWQEPQNDLFLTLCVPSDFIYSHTDACMHGHAHARMAHRPSFIVIAHKLKIFTVEDVMIVRSNGNFSDVWKLTGFANVEPTCSFSRWSQRFCTQFRWRLIVADTKEAPTEYIVFGRSGTWDVKWLLIVRVLDIFIVIRMSRL